MPHATITTELVRQMRHQRPSAVTDYRDPKLPGFVLRARPTGIHSWRVQLPNRRWLTIGRTDEVALSDARETAQTRRAQAALGHPPLRAAIIGSARAGRARPFALQLATG